LEAAACGRPIITTDTPGCREIVRDGENGILVPPRDAVALADAIERLVRDPLLRARMGARGRRRVEEEFSEERVVEQTIALYRSLLADRWPA
jgi:glycosyltransferase involved in cell wall biosynthesis